MLTPLMGESESDGGEYQVQSSEESSSSGGGDSSDDDDDGNGQGRRQQEAGAGAGGDDDAIANVNLDLASMGGPALSQLLTLVHAAAHAQGIPLPDGATTGM